MIRAGILTISDRASQGEYKDRSGPVIRELLVERLGAQVVKEAIVPDERAAIRETLIAWTDQDGVPLILTTGGTGFAPRDVTPEATQDVIDRQAPGLAEAMRAASLQVTPHAMLSRAVAGLRGGSLIVNLPGSPKAVRENLETILPALPHAIELLSDLPGASQRHAAEADDLSA